MAISSRERRLLTLTIGAIVVGATILLVAPLTKQWRTLSHDLIDRRRERDGIQQTIQRSVEWKTEYDKLRGKVSETPVRYDTPNDVLKKIEELVGPAGVIMIKQTTLAPVEKGIYRELPVQDRKSTRLNSSHPSIS